MRLRVAYTVELTSEQSERLAKLADHVGLVADSQRDLLKHLFMEYGRGCLGMEVDEVEAGEQ